MNIQNRISKSKVLILLGSIAMAGSAFASDAISFRDPDLKAFKDQLTVAGRVEFERLSDNVDSQEAALRLYEFVSQVSSPTGCWDENTGMRLSNPMALFCTDAAATRSQDSIANLQSQGRRLADSYRTRVGSDVGLGEEGSEVVVPPSLVLLQSASHRIRSTINRAYPSVVGQYNVARSDARRERLRSQCLISLHLRELGTPSDENIEASRRAVLALLQSPEVADMYKERIREIVPTTGSGETLDISSEEYLDRMHAFGVVQPDVGRLISVLRSIRSERGAPESSSETDERSSAIRASLVSTAASRIDAAFHTFTDSEQNRLNRCIARGSRSIEILPAPARAIASPRRRRMPPSVQTPGSSEEPAGAPSAVPAQ